MIELYWYISHTKISVKHEIIDQYTNCMDKADTIYWLPTYLTREDPKLEILTPQALTKNLINKSSLEFAEFR